MGTGFEGLYQTYHHISIIIIINGISMKKYEEIPWNNQGATERTRPKVQTAHVTLTFDLLTLKWYVTHHPPIRCICAPYEEIPSNNEGATERTRHAGRRDGRTDGVKPIYPQHNFVVRGV